MIPPEVSQLRLQENVSSRTVRIIVAGSHASDVQRSGELVQVTDCLVAERSSNFAEDSMTLPACCVAGNRQAPNAVAIIKATESTLRKPIRNNSLQKIMYDQMTQESLMSGRTQARIVGGKKIILKIVEIVFSKRLLTVMASVQ